MEAASVRTSRARQRRACSGYVTKITECVTAVIIEKSSSSVMSNEAEKKRIRNAAEVWRLYVAIVIGLYALFIVVRVFYFWSTFSTRHVVGALITAAVNAGGMFALHSALELGTEYNVVNDLLIINWAVMLTTTLITDWGWMLWLSVPAYVVYAYGSTIVALLSSLTRSSAPPLPDQTNVQQRKRSERRSARREH